MYKYTLSNNHYIVEIEGNKYLLDTGSPVSFSLKPSLRNVVINGRVFPLDPKPMNLSISSTRELVGMDVDGFIGMNIIRQTSLTVYKDGRLSFGVEDEEGTPLELLADDFGLLKLKFSCNDVVGAFLLDTGAKYGYGSKQLFLNNKEEKLFEHIYDYNPFIGHFDSDAYCFNFNFGPIQQVYEVGDSDDVRELMRLSSVKASAVGNITPLFKEVCVVDIDNGRLIVR